MEINKGNAYKTNRNDTPSHTAGSLKGLEFLEVICDNCNEGAECALCDQNKGVCAECCACGGKYSDWVESALRVTFTFDNETFQAVREFLEMRGGLAGFTEALEVAVCANCFTENCAGDCE
jgi:hypothetical protein